MKPVVKVVTGGYGLECAVFYGKGAIMEKRIVAVGDKGKRVGEDHGRARLTDHEVELMRRLWEEGMRQADIARKFETSKSTVCDILKGRRRATVPTGWKTVYA